MWAPRCSNFKPVLLHQQWQATQATEQPRQAEQGANTRRGKPSALSGPTLGRLVFLSIFTMPMVPKNCATASSVTLVGRPLQGGERNRQAVWRRQRLGRPLGAGAASVVRRAQQATARSVVGLAGPRRAAAPGAARSALMATMRGCKACSPDVDLVHIAGKGVHVHAAAVRARQAPFTADRLGRGTGAPCKLQRSSGCGGPGCGSQAWHLPAGMGHADLRERREEPVGP